MTYLNASELTPDEIEEESKKDILEANRQNLSNYNSNLKRGIDSKNNKKDE